jgi:hypothetical protein
MGGTEIAEPPCSLLALKSSCWAPTHLPSFVRGSGGVYVNCDLMLAPTRLDTTRMTGNRQQSPPGRLILLRGPDETRVVRVV